MDNQKAIDSGDTLTVTARGPQRMHDVPGLWRAAQRAVFTASGAADAGFYLVGTALDSEDRWSYVVQVPLPSPSRLVLIERRLVEAKEHYGLVEVTIQTGTRRGL